METTNSLETFTGWENMDRNILANIFGMLNVVDVIMGASRVCVSWFLASNNRTLWKSIDLTNLKSIITDNPEKVKSLDYDYKKSRYQLSDILIETTKFSNTITTTLFLDYYYSTQEEDLAIIAQRMPNLKKLSFSLWHNLDENSILSTFSLWKNLETLVIAQPGRPGIDPIIVNYQTIGDNCKNLTSLKLIRPLYQNLAEQIVSNFFNLKRLSCPCSSICKNALLSLVINHKNLKILNLSHCIWWDQVNNLVSIVSNDENLIQTATQKLDEFIVCSKPCKVCIEFWGLRFRDRSEEYKYYMFQNEQWKIDKIKELEF